MDRTTPVAHNEEIELYIRTYYSLLRSSAPIRVRSLEDTHAAMNSNLHQLAGQPELDISALSYCALRLPDCISRASLMVMGQMDDVFRREGYDLSECHEVKARARRRKFYFNPSDGTLAAYVASVSDIDDLIPCLTTYQIEWNKIHQKLVANNLHDLFQTAREVEPFVPVELLERVRSALELNVEDFTKLCQVWPGRLVIDNLRLAAQERMDIRVMVLGSGLSDYRRSVQHWWRKIESSCDEIGFGQRPIYFVSSNPHSMVNLISGVAWRLKNELIDYVERENPENLWTEFQTMQQDDVGALGNFLYYVSRLYFRDHKEGDLLYARAMKRERKAGVIRVSDPHYLDVEAQVIELNALRPKWLDPRLQTFDDQDWALLRNSEALIVNIDYPLGMAAYQIFSQLSTATGPILGCYILGKAATLNGRVGDVMIPNVVYDEHSRNSYLFRNCFTAQDVAPYLKFGTVFDNQKAVTVRGTILQNREFMHIFYEEGYTDIEMEAGPYLSAIYEDIYPKRYPVNEIVNLFINAPYDLGLIHYASDTPISRRQQLLSKSLSYFGVDATYATSIAVLGRVLEQEIERQAHLARPARHSSVPVAKANAQ